MEVTKVKVGQDYNVGLYGRSGGRGGDKGTVVAVLDDLVVTQGNRWGLQNKLCESWKAFRVNLRVGAKHVVVEVNGAKYIVPARNVVEPWSAYEERNREYLKAREEREAQQTAMRERQTTVLEVLQSLGIQARPHLQGAVAISLDDSEALVEALLAAVD